MSTPVTPAVPPTLEEKILQAATEAEQVVAVFSPQAAALVASGVAVEPIFSGLIHMIVGLFKHHAAQAAKPAAPAPAAPAPTA